MEYELENANFVIIEEALISIITYLNKKTTKEEIDDLKEYIKVGEYGVCFETLCAIIHDEQINIPAGIYNKIKSTGELMKFDSSYWTCFENLVFLK